MGLHTTSVFSKNLQAYTAGERIIVNQGGTRSSKTYSVLQLLLLIVVSAPHPLVLSVVSYALPHLKLGAMRSFDEILQNYGIPVDKVKNQSESFYKINNCIIEFFGVENIGKVHGPERDILFVNEANFIKPEVIDQLIVRTRRRVFIDFNPSSEFWFHGEDFQARHPKVIKSTYTDNEYLTPLQIASIEAKKKNARWWRVYGEGELGTLEGAVFDGWQYCKVEDIPVGQTVGGWGQDYGFSKDPTTLVRLDIDFKAKAVYWRECHYSTGELKSREAIAAVNRAHTGVAGLIVGDSAEARLIYELRRSEGLNIVPCLPESKKSVSARLMRMLDYTHYVTEDSPNIAREMNYYTWIDKKGKVVIDDYNHAIDAGGYIFDYLTIRPPITGGRWAR